MCAKPAAPSRKPSLHEVEAHEARERRHDEPQRRDALAARVHRRGLQRRVAVLLRDVLVERFGRRVQQVAGEPRPPPRRRDVLVHGVVAPARVAAIEQAHVPVGIAFAVREPAAEEAVAARHRVGASAAASPAVASAARWPRPAPGVTRSSASRHSTQSFAALRDREILLRRRIPPGAAR